MAPYERRLGPAEGELHREGLIQEPLGALPGQMFVRSCRSREATSEQLSSEIVLRVKIDTAGVNQHRIIQETMLNRTKTSTTQTPCGG